MNTKVLFLALSTLFSAVDASVPLTITGRRFIQASTTSKGDGEVFFIKGVDYQPGGSSAYTGDVSAGDVLSNEEACYRDAYAFQQAGINTIRVYTINPDVNHDACMSILNDAGIYAILDVNSALYGESLNRDDPSGSYNKDYMTRVFKVIEAFMGYPNVLGFFSGNEIINNNSSANNDPSYIRAVQRDMKQYISKHANRTIPVGYSAADVTAYRKVSFDYLSCDNGDNSHSDFFGLNSYEWCSGATFSSSGYDSMNTSFADAAIPLFFSEFGCNTVTPRTFEEVSEGIFGGLKDIFSGGLVYEYAEEENKYGLVGVDSSDSSVTFKTDYDNYKSQLAKAGNITIDSKSVSTADLPKCSSDTIKSDGSDFETSFDIPSQPDGVASLINNGVNATNIGKIISVDSRASNLTIKGSDGNAISNPIVTFPASALVNEVDGTTASVSSATTSSSSASNSATSTSTTSKKGAAVANYGSYSSGLLAIVFSFLI